MSIDQIKADLRGQAAIVTGASSGVGHATALSLAREGVRIVLTARREDRLRGLQKQILSLGGGAAICTGDTGEEATAQACLQSALENFGRIDIVVNNAGQGRYQPLAATSAAEFDELMKVNMRSSFLFSRAAVPHLIAQRSGTLIFVSSVAGLHGQANESVYSASKFAQVGFAQALSEELRGYGIRACAICPGGVKTEFAIGHGRTAESVAASPMMNPDQVADAIVFACMQPRNVRIVQMTIRHMGEP